MADQFDYPDVPTPPAPVPFVVLSAEESTSRRRFGRQVLLGLSALGAAVAASPQVAAAGTSSDTWKMEGNDNVDTNDFIGSRNDASLIFKTRNVERMRITRPGPIGVNTPSPAGAFHVVGISAISPVGIRGDSNATGEQAVGVLGTHPKNGTGVSGTAGEDGTGVSGVAGLGGTGVSGAAGQGGVGVRGSVDPDSGGTGVAGSGGRRGTGVYGSSNEGPGVHGESEGDTGVVGVYGQAIGSGSSRYYGVVGAANSTEDNDGGTGVFGFSDRGTGVAGQSNAPEGVAIIAAATAANSTGLQASGGRIGVVGSSSTVPGNIGVFGYSSQDVDLSRGDLEGTNLFTSISPEGTTGVRGIGTAVGVSGLASDNNGIGVLGIAYTQAANSYAGYFAGQVAITGDLRADNEIRSSAAGFVIKHPLTPETHTLAHAFVASPERQVCYNGNVNLDAAGTAIVSLPAYAEALSTAFRYQLTPIGAPAPDLHIAQTVNAGQFRIAGGPANLVISWQVTGVRQDSYANAHPQVVEQANGG